MYKENIKRINSIACLYRKVNRYAFFSNSVKISFLSDKKKGKHILSSTCIVEK
jgi:hypothetical protein